MPFCRITNYTSRSLNVSLKHLCALHFENEVVPGATVKLKPGRVWFTLEVLVDDGEATRYSLAQSAAAIAIVSLACVGTAATAAVAIPAVAGGAAIGGAAGSIGSTLSSAVVAGGAGLLAAGDTLVAGFAAGVTTASTFLASHAGVAAKLSAMFLPRAIEAVEKEVGGFTAVQKEVITILSSPTVTDDVRTQGFSILSRLGVAVAADRAAAAEAEAKDPADKNKENIKDGSNNSSQGQTPPPPYSKDDPSSKHSRSPSSKSPSARPSLKRMQTSVSTLMHKMSNENREERKAAKREAKEAKEVASWEVVDVDADKDTGMLSTKERLRIHGLFMNERRHFEVREREGKLVLVDANTKEVVVG